MLCNIYLPCSQTLNPAGDTSHVNYFRLSRALCSEMKENSRINKPLAFSWLAGWFCPLFNVQLCAACASFSKTIRRNHVSHFPLTVGQTPSSATADTSADIKRLCRSEVAKTATSNWDMSNNLSGDVSHISFPPWPFISFLWDNTLVSVSQGSAILVSVFGFMSRFTARMLSELCSVSYFRLSHREGHHSQKMMRQRSP